MSSSNRGGRSGAPKHELRMSGCVLVVDDEKNIRRTLRMVLEGEGATVLEASTGEEALEVLQRMRAGGRGGAEPSPDAVIMDVLLPGISGLEVLETLAGQEEEGLPVPIILISGHATVSDAVRATRLGAFDFFEKPLSRDRVVVGVRNALRQARAEAQLRTLRHQVHGEIVAISEEMLELLELVAKVARSKARVLIHGESGTGKELVARAIHDASDRAQGPFVKVNCAAIPRELIESELFGHERGAFTGATRQKKGLFEVSSGGTIFLDEIGDMDLGAQAKVLRVLQSGELMRVGGGEAIQVDTRVLAATHRDLRKQVESGEFREDLYFRLNVVPLQVPPLRDRPSDIPVLARYFVEVSCRENGLGLKGVDDRAVEVLCRHTWPGNVRELRNVIERMVVLSDGDLGLDDLPPELRDPEGAADGDHPIDRSWLDELLGGAEGEHISLKAFREAVERAYILQRLRENSWNVSRTAEVLMIERTHLHRKMKLLGIQRGQS